MNLEGVMLKWNKSDRERQILYDITYIRNLKKKQQGFPCGSDSKESACNVGDLGLIPELGRSPGEENGYPLQYSGLENSTDCLVHGVTKSQTLRISVKKKTTNEYNKKLADSQIQRIN